MVIACNFCPFAKREMNKGSIHYSVLETSDEKIILQELSCICKMMDTDPGTETSLLIFPESQGGFLNYLNILELCEALMNTEGYESIYQIASFHPEYLFAGCSEDDPANYTNRSPYPMLHILREDSVSMAVDHYNNAEDIPSINIAFARKKGLADMVRLRDSCLD